MLNFQSIYGELATRLAPILGTYTTLAGDTIPAIALRSGKNEPDQYVKTGLEVIIYQQPTASLQILLPNLVLTTALGILILRQHSDVQNAVDFLLVATDELQAVDPQIQINFAAIAGVHRDETLQAVASLNIPFQFQVI